MNIIRIAEETGCIVLLQNGVAIDWQFVNKFRFDDMHIYEKRHIGNLLASANNIIDYSFEI